MGMCMRKYVVFAGRAVQLVLRGDTIVRLSRRYYARGIRRCAIDVTDHCGFGFWATLEVTTAPARTVRVGKRQAVASTAAAYCYHNTKILQLSGRKIDGERAVQSQQPVITINFS